METGGKVLQITAAGVSEPPPVVLSRLRDLMAGFEKAYLFEASRWIHGLHDIVGTDATEPILNPVVADTVVALPIGEELRWALPITAAREVLEVLWRSRMEEPLKGKIKAVETLDAHLWQAHYFHRMMPMLGRAALEEINFKAWFDFGPNGLQLSEISLNQAKALVKLQKENPDYSWAAVGKAILAQDRKIRGGASPLLPGLN